MEISEYKKTRKHVLIAHSLVLIVMIIISAIAFPYLWANFDCNAYIGKLTCNEATFAKYFALLYFPMFQLVFVLS